METVKQAKKKKLGRPQISDELKKIRIATYVTPEINKTTSTAERPLTFRQRFC